MENFKIVISQVVNKNNMWYVEACVDVREIMQNDKKLLKLLSKQKDLKCYKNGLMSIDNFIDALMENKKFYNRFLRKTFYKFSLIYIRAFLISVNVLSARKSILSIPICSSTFILNCVTISSPFLASGI